MQFWTADMEKQVSDRVQLVLTDPTLLSVYRKFGAGAFRRSSVFHGLDRSLKDWGVRGKQCIEIGTFNGITAAILSRYFDHVVTVDVLPNTAKKEILEHLGIRNVTTIDVSDNCEKAAVLKDLDFDFAYLDGDHAHDTESDWALVKKCGRVLFHEVWPFQEPVWNLVHRFKMENVKHNGCGLALWENGNDAV